MAQAQGFDPNNLPEAIYAPTNTDITRAHFRQQAVAELNTIEPIVAAGLAPYSRRFDGYSPLQIADALSGENPERQIEFLMAKGVQPEIAGLRVKSMGGQVGIEAIREAQDAAVGRIKIYQAGVSPEIFRKAQERIRQVINMGVERANSVGFNPEKAQNKDVGRNTSAANYSDADLQHTADKYGMTVDQVKKKLGM
jgi:hypothetical protein